MSLPCFNACFLAWTCLAIFSIDVAHAAWPGSNGQIAFTRDGQLFAVEPDGSGEELIVDGVNASWSPDGITLAYSCDGQICTIPADGSSEGTAITVDPTLRSIHPAWSPDGDRIVFARREVVNTDRNPAQLYTIAADGSDERALDVNGKDPAWSPDGDRIIFMQGLQGDGIYSISPDGEDFERLLKADGYIHSLGWSPGGELVAFTLQKNNHWRIWLMGKDGSNPRELFRGKGRKKGGTEVSGRGLSWSPNGRRIIYLSFFRDSLCKVDLEGRRRGCLKTYGEYPDWGPIP